MDLLPDWAPNLHPLVVHFPLALLATAVLLDLLALLVRKEAGLRIAAVLVYVLGGVGALAAFLTGRDAADTVAPSGAANAVLTEHADWAEYTVWFYGLYALVRLAVLLFDRRPRVGLWAGLWLVGAGGLFLLWETGEHGAQMVFEHGVGVQAVARLDSIAQAHQDALDRSRADGAAPLADDGGWRWIPAEGADLALASSFRWLEGDPAAVRPAVVEADGRTALRLDAQGTPALFVLDRDLAAVQADAAVDLSDFSGSFALLHHVQDARNYHFLAVEGGTMQQGRVVDGTEEVMDEAPLEGSGWRQLRVVGDRTHFRGYAGGTLITHGHGDAPPPGAVGFRIVGTGTVRLGTVRVEALR